MIIDFSQATFGWAKNHWQTQQSTRSPGVVQAISMHMYRTHIALNDSKCQQGHLAHIAHSESMTNVFWQDTNQDLCSIPTQ